jgi:hypothetical protein
MHSSYYQQFVNARTSLYSWPWREQKKPSATLLPSARALKSANAGIAELPDGQAGMGPHLRMAWRYGDAEGDVKDPTALQLHCDDGTRIGNSSNAIGLRGEARVAITICRCAQNAAKPEPR